ncbi:interleukin-17 receptor E-like protein isoform X2 [Pogona vitticeps]
MMFKIQIFVMFWGTYGYDLIPRIEECGITCTQGFLCKIQASANIFNSFCHHAPTSLSPTNLRSMKVWTVMKCMGQNQCSLHLSVKGTLHLDESIRGMEICALSVDTQKSKCVNVIISRNVHVKLAGRKVKMQFNCFEVSAGQHFYVTMRTIPNYCGIKLSQEYDVEDCRNIDVARNIPMCFDGKMAYEVDRVQNIISVNISNLVQGTDYYVRLCRQWFVCEDEGPVTLIQKKDTVKSVSLQYTQVLPCLCIEAWPAISDARRIQICPFKNDTKALWDNIHYNPVTQMLAWEAACPVHVTVSLCQLMQMDDRCVDLEKTSKTTPEKVKYSRVDAHPRLCMKFTNKYGSWVRCPFGHENFQAWKMRLAVMKEQIEVSFTSHPEAQFSVIVCNRTESSSCNSTGIHQLILVDGSSSISLNISRKMCDPDLCIQGWRTDVDYSLPSYICDLPCILDRKGHEEESTADIKIQRIKSITSLH